MKNLILSALILPFVSTGSAHNMTIQVTSPSSNARYQVCSDIRLAADATVQSGGIKRVDFYINGSRFEAVRQAPYEANWTSVPDGIYEIYATGIDLDNAETSTEPFFIYVGNVEPGNVIINGEFNCSLSPWFLDNYVNAVSTASIVPDLWLTDDSSGVLVDIQNQGDEFWAIQLMQPFQIQKGHTYEVTFTAQTDDPKEIYVDIGKNYDDFAPLHSFKINVDKWEVYGPLTFEAAGDDDNLMFKFVLGGNTIPIEIDAVRVIDQQWTSIAAETRSATYFALGQNYPNPFNPATTIEYALSKNGYVEMKIFDLLGKQVRVLVAGERTAGRHHIIWNGLDDSGRRVASGLYLYTLTADGYTETKKLLLIK